MITLASLFAPESYARILNKGLDLAATVGLPVTSWRAGDPTKSLYEFTAEILAQLELVIQEQIAAAFLSFATGDWLTLRAEQVYGVTRIEATYATSASGQGVTLLNTGGGQYTIEPGKYTFKSSTNGKTYHNTTGGTLASGPGTTITLEFVADEAGSASSVSADEIDEMVTTELGVEVQSSAAAQGLDEESDVALRARCLDSLGALSPDGPADAYRFVALNPELTGVTDVTKAEPTSDAPTGVVTLYLAAPSGPVGGGSVTAVADAIARWATPLTVTPIVESATGVTVDIDMTVYVRAASGLDEPTVESAVDDALGVLFAELAIGGDEGELAVSKISAVPFAINQSTAGAVYRVDVANPAANVPLDPDEVAVLGTVAITVVFT